MTLTIPELSLVVLIGVSGSGKSTFALRHFKATEILSSDACRGLVSDDENNQAATNDAFDVLNFIARKRLAAGKLTVVDATNVQPQARQPLVELARDFHCLPVAIVLDVPERLAQERNRGRANRNFGPRVIRQQATQLHHALRKLDREGFRRVYVLKSEEEISTAEIVREPLWCNRKDEHGPFDIIGDVHGCFDELIELLAKLGYAEQPGGAWAHAAGRKLVFVGDLVDRGPKSPEVMHLVMESVKSGSALAVPGNHDVKFMRKIFGGEVQIAHGLAESLAQFEAAEVSRPGFTRSAAEFIDSLVSHYVFDDGRLVVAHAGLKESMQGRGSASVRAFCLFGETTGEVDEFGLPMRHNWAADYRGHASVVYGHTPVVAPEWLNNAIDIDTGCVFGWRLTALRWPEKEILSVPARANYAQPGRPLILPGASGGEPGESAPASPALSAQHAHDDLLDIADVTGKRIVTTRLQHNVTIREEHAAAALEVMSRFAANPKWLIYLPPTMSPVETHGSAESAKAKAQIPADGSEQHALEPVAAECTMVAESDKETAEPLKEGVAASGTILEHPAEAFAYFRARGIARVVCEEKHMGSRAVVIVCRDEEAARERFGIAGEGIGIVVTRTGRRFFDDAAMERALLAHVRDAAESSGIFQGLETTWLCLDCELMPWSAKAQELIRQQYAAVGAASRMAFAEADSVLAACAAPGAAELRARFADRAAMAAKYRAAYRRYCWSVSSLEDLKLAPFHLLASEGAAHADKSHDWHMAQIGRMVEAGGLPLFATPWRIVETADPASEAEATAWWTDLTAQGGEGMVVKPLDFIARDPRGRLVQPALKVRGADYLRIIYGPEYDAPEHLSRLRARSVGAKRSLAAREFALGIEALERFVRREPLRRVHECVFGVLALESEPIDPRL